MSVQDRIRKYRREGGGKDLVRVEVLVPADSREDVRILAACLRASHRNRAARLSDLMKGALAQYGTRVLDNVDLDRLSDPRQRALVVAKALMERGDAQAFALGRRIQDAVAWRDERLHQANLAVDKVLAVTSRIKASDFVDLVRIEERMCPLGPLVMAAAGKPPHFSPQKIVDEVRRRGLSVASEDYDSVRGIPADWDAACVRERLSAALDRAEAYLKSAPVDIVGVLATDADGTPVEVTSLEEVAQRGIALRRATEEPEVMPEPADAASEWGGSGP